MTDLSIVIVNRNTRELLLACIGSVYATVPPLSFEIWVVDNASSDGSVEAVRHAFPAVRCIENDRNLGFARANNLAIRQAHGRYVVLLNTDTVLTVSALATIFGFMERNRDVAICGGQLLNGDGSLQNSIASVPTLATEILNKSLLRLMFPERYPGKESRFDQPVEVESIIGACMVVAKEAIDGVGPLDESYFFFFEETDWCLSMKREGWRVFFHPQARIYHLQGQTARKNIVAARIEYWKSRYLFFRKHYPAAHLVFLGAGLVARLCMSLALQLVASPFSRSARTRLRVNAMLLFWHLLGCPAGWGLEKGAAQG
ncbi:MAG TPA: glycosyltransferase family 2 protein [Geobacteraceae bacterium]